MKYFSKTAAAAGFVAVAGLASLSSPNEAHAMFDICKKVNITVQNQTGAPIQLFDLDYHDYGSNRKRSENITNRVIPNGGSYSWQRNLEGVNNAKTYIRAQFRKLKSNGRWDLGRYWWQNSATSVCSRGKSYRVVLR
ncbi:hypothetical protein [Roseibium aggregatum]|uniref:Uncharacterized protein n=1 Tax=Roseibium aggregatum TaxID=187304 RepID=A0A939J3W9_9HYPH|nr:hypothetical protein [Roseibium aggregatum]MBN9671022.1 hypothetical protein [Roseibium aggregatum]